MAVARVIGGDVAAHAELGAAIADDHPPVDDARRAGDRIALRLVDGDDAPQDVAIVAVERDQPAVERADEKRVAPGGDAAIDRVAADPLQPVARHLRIVGPEQAAGAAVIGLDHRPGGRGVEIAVDDDRRRFLAAAGVEIGEPGEAEPADILAIDRFERAVPLLVIGAAGGEPVGAVIVGGDDPLAIDRAFGIVLRRALLAAGEDQGGRERGDQSATHQSLPTSRTVSSEPSSPGRPNAASSAPSCPSFRRRCAGSPRRRRPTWAP